MSTTFVNKATREEVLESSRSSWVRMAPVFDENGNPIPGFEVVRDGASHFPIQISNGRFKPIQNVQVLTQVFGELDSHLDKNWEIVDWKMIHEPKKSQMKLTVSLPTFDSFDADGSKIIPVMNIRNSNDGSCSLSFDVGAWRLICSNGLSMFTNMANLFRRRHTSQFRFESLNFEKIAKEYQVLEHMISKAQEVVITEEIKKIFIASGFSKKVINDLPSYFERYDESVSEQIKDFTKVWALYAVLTNWITNVVEKKNVVMAQHYSNQLNRAMKKSLG